MSSVGTAFVFRVTLQKNDEEYLLKADQFFTSKKPLIVFRVVKQEETHPKACMFLAIFHYGLGKVTLDDIKNDMDAFVAKQGLVRVNRDKEFFAEYPDLLHTPNVSPEKGLCPKDFFAYHTNPWDDEISWLWIQNKTRDGLVLFHQNIPVDYLEDMVHRKVIPESYVTSMDLEEVQNNQPKRLQDVDENIVKCPKYMYQDSDEYFPEAPPLSPLCPPDFPEDGAQKEAEEADDTRSDPVVVKAVTDIQQVLHTLDKKQRRKVLFKLRLTSLKRAILEESSDEESSGKEKVQEPPAKVARHTSPPPTLPSSYFRTDHPDCPYFNAYLDD
jgi:hypothetical protein